MFSRPAGGAIFSALALAGRGATGRALVSTNFDVPATMDTGPAGLVVVANGIASTPVAIDVR